MERKIVKNIKIYAFDKNRAKKALPVQNSILEVIHKEFTGKHDKMLV